MLTLRERRRPPLNPCCMIFWSTLFFLYLLLSG